MRAYKLTPPPCTPMVHGIPCPACVGKRELAEIHNHPRVSAGWCQHHAVLDVVADYVGYVRSNTNVSVEIDAHSFRSSGHPEVCLQADADVDDQYHFPQSLTIQPCVGGWMVKSDRYHTVVTKVDEIRSVLERLYAASFLLAKKKSFVGEPR